MTDDEVKARIAEIVPPDSGWAEGEDDEVERAHDHLQFAGWCLNWIRRDWAYEDGMDPHEDSCTDEIASVDYVGDGPCGLCDRPDCAVILHVEFTTPREGADISIPV